VAAVPVRLQDWKYVRRARRAGANHAIRIIEEARAADLPLSWAFALVQQESGFRNVFGYDRGSILHGQKVTKDRVTRLLRWIDQGGVSNGVGLTQLTWPAYIRSAQRKGGAHKPRIQLRVGFTVFKGVAGPGFDDAWRYNGARAYQAQIEAKQRRWHDLLTG
jgi:hypothetical protein